MDFTTCHTNNILVAVEYATGTVRARLTTGQTMGDTVPLCDEIRRSFGSPRGIVIDNSFDAAEFRAYWRPYGTRLVPILPRHPRTNGRVEQVNGQLRAIINRELQSLPDRPGTPDRPGYVIPFADRLQRAVHIRNRTFGPSGYSPCYLLYGTQPQDVNSWPDASPAMQYVREHTAEEQVAFERELVKLNKAPMARSYIASLKAARAAVREELQASKAIERVYGKGDWLLRVRKDARKGEPHYDGPWRIASCHAGNTYQLRSPGGIDFPGHYSGQVLFPAYTRDGHPVRSMWYASKAKLDADRARRLEAVGL